MDNLHRLIVVALELAILTISTATVLAQDFVYITNNGTVTVMFYTGPGGDVTIPESVNGLPVTSIGDLTFFNCSALTNVTIPPSVTSIGAMAFAECSDLTNLLLPDSVSSVGSWAFAKCCRLKAVVLSTNVSHIGTGAFGGCSGLNAIEVDPQNRFYCSVDGVVFDKHLLTIVQCPAGRVGTYNIPSGVVSIEGGAFYGCSNLTNVTIPDGVTSVRDGEVNCWGTWGAFASCTSLQSITMPNGVTNIGIGAFGNCIGLTNVSMPPSIASIRDGAYWSCTSLNSVTIPEGVASIGQSAFGSCTGLTNLTIGKGVTTVGIYAYSGCSNLNKVIIPATVSSLGEMAFAWCNGLAGAYFEGDAPTKVNIYDNDVFYDNNTTIYRLPGTSGWLDTFGRHPTSFWVLPHPVILTTASYFGIQNNQFGFRISWATNASVVVETSGTMVNPVWSPVSTNTLVNGWADFRDAEWKNHPVRFYRVRSY